MSHGNIIASGQASASSTVTLTQATSTWMLTLAASTTDASVIFDGKYTVYLPKLLTNYVAISGNYQTMAVSGATVNYIAYG
jgi:hypothetical protein